MTMASQEASYNQVLTYWRRIGVSGTGGDVFASPVTMRCRCEQIVAEKVSVAYKVAGDSISPDSIIFTPVPLEAGGWVLLGESLEASPKKVVGASVIRLVFTTPSLRIDDDAEYRAVL